MKQRTQTLWRLVFDEAQPLNTALMHDNLRLHLEYADLITVLMQIGQRQQAYVALRGCPGCRDEQCEPGCRVELLRRALHASGVRDGRSVPDGLARRTYTRAVLAWPKRDSQPLDGTLLQTWSEARLWVSWGCARRQRFGCAATLLVSADGPDPIAALRARGWWALGLPSCFARRVIGSTVPAAAWVPGHWSDSPFMLVPASPPPTHNPPMPEASACEEEKGDDPPDDSPPPNGDGAALSEALDLFLAAQLAPLLDPRADADDAAFQLLAAERQNQGVHTMTSTINGDDIHTPEVTTAVAELPPPSIWPGGPGRMQPDDVAFLIEQVQSSPIVVNGSEPGVTRKRLAYLLSDELSEYSRQLMLWLHQADVLAPPLVPDEPFRNPRLLRPLTDEQFAERLAATPLPTPEAAKAAMAKG